MSTKANSIENAPGTAKRLLGQFPPKEWHSRGYLPHRDKPGILQMITYHLADSLPTKVLEKYKMEIQSLPSDKQNSQYRRKIEEWIDAGHGSCTLKNPQIAQLVFDNFKFYNGKRYDLISWVIMPNHVHVLINVYEGVSLSKIIQSWKGYTGKKINEFYKNTGNAKNTRNAGNADCLVGKGTKKDAKQTLSGPGRVWHREYWDRYIRDEKHFNSAVDYIEQNPVKAGLVNSAKDWQWSSAK